MNWTRLAQLRAEVGDEALSEVLGLFLAETDAVAERLRSAGASDGLSDDVHFMKGAALNVGFDEVAAQCDHAEAAAEAGPVDPEPILHTYRAARDMLVSEAPRFGIRL